MGLFLYIIIVQIYPTMKHLPTFINLCAGFFLIILGTVGYFSPEWFFTQKYDVLMPTPQSTTILRVMMGFMATVGGIWFVVTFLAIDQRRMLFITGTLTLGFILSRLGGLFLDGFNQRFTYIELAFEAFALAVIVWVYHKQKKP